MNAVFTKLAKWSATAGMAMGIAGCSTNTGNGALIGGAAGAGIGAIAGHNSRHGNTAGGALVGGVIGAIAGAVIGNEVDREEDYRDRRYYYYEDRPVYRRYRVYRVDPYAYPPPPPPMREDYDP